MGSVFHLQSRVGTYGDDVYVDPRYETVPQNIVVLRPFVWGFDFDVCSWGTVVHV